MPVNHVVFDNRTLVDLRSDTVTEDTLLEGATAHDATGAKVTGKLTIPTGISVASISITTPPTKTTYLAGETFDPAGMVVKATYSNGATLTATGYFYDPSNALVDGTTSVTILYTEGGVTVTASQAITVIHRLNSISVTKNPTKTSYEYGDTFDASGMVVTANYSDGASAAVSGYTNSPTTLNTVGTQTITVSYTERNITKTTTLSINVARKTISATPTQSGSLTYSGSAQSPSWSGYDAAKMTLGGVTNATNAGSYNATFTPTANYRWSDGTTTAKTVTWSIAKAAGSLSISPTSLSLTASAKTGTITVTRAGDGAITATSSNTSIATVSVSGTKVTVTGKASGSATITISVGAGTNHNAPSNKTCSVSVKLLDSTFANNDWATIIEACQNNEVPSTWKVGDSKYMSVNGFNRSVMIVGKNHDTYSSGGTAPLTFQINGHVLGKTAAMNASSSNRTGWSGCVMRNSTLWEVFDTLPSEVQDGIRYVDKMTTKGGGSSSIETTEDALFLLSEVEMFGSATISGSGEGSQYAYYAAGNSISPSEHLWFRSPYLNNSTSYCGMVYYGGVSYWGASTILGISFAFCF